MNKFNLLPTDLNKLLVSLNDKKIIEFTYVPYDSSLRILDLEPPLDGLNLLITNKCNLCCKHCYVNGGKQLKNELDWNEWVEIIDEGIKMGVFALNISGGEPLLLNNFDKLVEYLASVNSLNKNLNTNGTLINKKNVKNIAKAFDSVQISLDATVPKEHDSFREAKGCFEKTLSAIKLLTSEGVNIKVAMSLRENTLGSLDDMVCLCEKLKVSTLIIGFVENIGRAKEQETKMYGSFKKIYKTLKKLSKRKSNVKILLPFRFSADFSKIKEKVYICDNDNNQRVYIMADGNVLPCDKFPATSQFICGNIKEDSLKNIWLSDKMKRFKLMKWDSIPECKHCKYLVVCGGTCIARSYHEKGCINSPDGIACTMVKQMMDSSDINKNWWKSTFKKEYSESLGRIYTIKKAVEEVEFILKNIPLNEKFKILDVPCGEGRHSILLAKKGFDVTAIDYSNELLNIAKRKAKEEVVRIKFIQEDMRFMKIDKKFDVVITLGNSFGYFNDRDNKKFINNVSIHLKPNGYFILDLSNFEGIKKNMAPEIKRELDLNGVKVLEEGKFDKINQTSKLIWTIIGKDKKNKLYAKLRFYTLLEIEKILKQYNLKILKTYGSFEGSEYSVDTPRLIIIPQKSV